MPFGYYTIEKWIKPRGKAGRWEPVCHLGAQHNLADVLRHLEALGKPGMFRVFQMQRVVWGEVKDGRLKLRKCHSSSPEGLARITAMFDEAKGIYPIEKVRAERAAAKAGKKNGRKSGRR